MKLFGVADGEELVPMAGVMVKLAVKLKWMGSGKNLKRWRWFVMETPGTWRISVNSIVTRLS